MNQQVGSILIVVGLILVVVGALFWAGGLSWFGRLPGDIRIERESVRVYVPCASMILISLALSLLLNLLQRLR